MKSIVGTKEWEEACAEYVAALDKAAETGYKGWEHASCDHAYGYCTEGGYK